MPALQDIGVGCHHVEDWALALLPHFPALRCMTPVGVTDGLPQSVQLIGPRYREDLCLDAAEAIEARLGVPTPIDHR